MQFQHPKLCYIFIQSLQYISVLWYMYHEEQEAVPEENLKLAIIQEIKKMCRWFQ